MKKSTSEKNVNLIKAQHDFTDFSVKYISDWTKKELNNFINQPVVIPIGNHGFKIGPYKVQRLQPDCWKITSEYNDKFINFFMSKSAAILYSIYSVRNNYNLANELLEVDRKLGKIDTDVKHYSASLQNARNKKDNFKYSIVLNRYIDAKMQRRAYVNILKKTINLAKYMNFGNQTI